MRSAWLEASNCAVIGAPEAHNLGVSPETPGAACVERSGAGLSGREWLVAAVILTLAPACWVYGFVQGVAVSAPITGYPCATEWAR